MALGAGLPGVVISLLLLWAGDYTTKVQLTLTLFIIIIWIGYSFALRERVVRPLQTISNLLAALREGDYSIRARRSNQDDALGDVIIEVNALGGTLREQRLGALEATALLRTVMSKIDVAVFRFRYGRAVAACESGRRTFDGPACRKIAGPLSQHARA